MIWLFITMLAIWMFSVSYRLLKDEQQIQRNLTRLEELENKDKNNPPQENNNEANT